MLRITEYMADALAGKRGRPFTKSILIWNLTNVCNLSCAHCYASSRAEAQDELSLDEILATIPDLVEADMAFAILSGGEPLIRKDLFTIAGALREGGIKTYLSTNGLLVNEKNMPSIQETFDYVGISIDGTPEIHDKFRGKKGAFDRSMKSIRLCLEAGIRTGMRFTLTKMTRKCLPYIFDLAEKEGIPKIYISHLVYAGRGGQLASLNREQYGEAMEFILDKARTYLETDRPHQVVTGNSETDAVYLWQYFHRHYPEHSEALHQRLVQWGGNQAGVRMANIDYKGRVKPDPFCPEVLGNLREQSFGEIWKDHPLLQQLRQKPRSIEGKCTSCPFIQICNGNSRARSLAVHGNYWGEDPYCYWPWDSSSTSSEALPMETNSMSSNESGPKCRW